MMRYLHKYTTTLLAINYVLLSDIAECRPTPGLLDSAGSTNGNLHDFLLSYNSLNTNIGGEDNDYLHHQLYLDDIDYAKHEISADNEDKTEKIHPIQELQITNQGDDGKEILQLTITQHDVQPETQCELKIAQEMLHSLQGTVTPGSLLGSEAYTDRDRIAFTQQGHYSIKNKMMKTKLRVYGLTKAQAKVVAVDFYYARLFVSKVQEILRGGPPFGEEWFDEVYQKYFGTSRNNDYQILESILSKIVKERKKIYIVPKNTAIQDCIASTYLNHAKGLIYLTPSQYFANLKTNIQERMTTLVHELTHHFGCFDHKLPGTDVVAYGRESCQLLASQDPSLALTNAENIAYFVIDLMNNRLDMGMENDMDYGGPEHILKFEVKTKQEPLEHGNDEEDYNEMMSLMDSEFTDVSSKRRGDHKLEKEYKRVKHSKIKE